MKRALPLWLAAVVPTTLAAHGLAYILSGRSTAGAEHAWVMPAMECSVAFLVALCTAATASALLRAGVFMHTAAEHSTIALWGRLAVSQIAIFALMEQAEGSHAGLFGCAVQVLAALCVAFLLALFSRMLARCVRCARSFSRYIERISRIGSTFVPRRPRSIAYALFVCAGSARFQRPPPVSG